jgi:hypothetical protein
MKKLFFVVVAIFITGTASAGMPIFNANCPIGLNVESNPAGQVYINGKEARIIQRPDGQITARSGGVWIDITPRGDHLPLVTYTAADKTVGVCEVLSFRAPGSAAASAEAAPAAPEDGGPRNWVVSGVSSALNLREQPSATAAVVASFKNGTILDNLGCQQAGDRTWCDVQQLGGGPRGYVSAEFVKPAVSPDGSVKTGPDDSALRAGQGEFDATGPLPCARYAGQPMGQCEFGVARAGGGYATVVITHPDGFIRTIYFRMARAIGADTSQADGYPEFSAIRENGMHLIRIGDERYEIVDAVILGG